MQEDVWKKKGWTLPDACIAYEVMRSGGNGGQGVNTTDSAVRARVHVWAIPVLTTEERARVIEKLRSRITDTGELTVRIQTTRSQHENKRLAKARLEELIADALYIPKKRVATKPTRGSVERRLAHKKYIGEKKKQRSDEGNTW